jgi:hypothetical protein
MPFTPVAGEIIAEELLCAVLNGVLTDPFVAAVTKTKKAGARPAFP